MSSHPTSDDEAAFGAEPNDQGMKYTFNIFRDWRGMYRWMLTDSAGERVLTSRFGFAAPAGAFRDVEIEKAAGHYAAADVLDEIGR